MTHKRRTIRERAVEYAQEGYDLLAEKVRQYSAPDSPHDRDESADYRRGVRCGLGVALSLARAVLGAMRDEL